MTFKIFFFLIIIALTSNSHSQWWVDGGNVIWPHGDVTISKGRLLIKDSDTTTSNIWTDTESSIFARGNRSSWWGVIQAEAIGVDGDDPTIPLYGIKGHTTSYYSSGELYNGTWGGYFSNNPRLSGTATTKTNFNFPTNSVTGVMGEIAVNSHTQVDLDITCGVGAYLIAYQMENDMTNYLGFGSTGWIAESDSFSVENYFSYYSRPALLLKDITKYYAYYSDDLYPGTNISNFYHFYGKGDHPSYTEGSYSMKYNIQRQSLEIYGRASDITIDNTGYELVLYKNDLDVSANSIYWDSTYNYVAIDFSPVTYNFSNYEPVPNSFIATADTGSGWFSVRCMVNTETNPDTTLTFTFYSLSDNSVFTESNLDKVSFPIDVKLVLTNDAELGYQYLSTY